MLSLLTKYKEGEVTLSFLVNSLEGSLSTLEEKLPGDFYAAWYKHWGELETYLALNLAKERKAEVLEEVETLITQLKQSLKS